MEKSLKIWLRINGFQPCSWTFVWYHLKNAFTRLGYNIPLNPSTPPQNVEEYVELWWGDPQFWQWSDANVKLRAGIALSEAHSILKQGREKAIANVQKCDVLFCPSISATTAWREAPIDVPIYVVPFGVDDQKYSYIDRNWNDEMRFLLLGNTQFRKGSWLAPEAFIKAFSEKDNTKLTIACFAGYTPMFTQLKNEYGDHPQIEFTTEMKKTSIEYYKDYHVILSPHLAEGFGLIIPEALATGMAGIVARCSAPREFFSKDFGWWIEMSEMYVPVNQCLIDTGGFWRVPDVSDLAKKMRYAYEHRKEAQQKGKVASKYILKNLTWLQTARKIEKMLEEAVNGNISSYASLQRGDIIAL